MDFALPLGVLGASLVGSVHCAAMCGSFVCAYAAPGGAMGAAQHVAYNTGRLASYLLLGALAGSLGAGLDASGALMGIGRGATIVSGLLLIAWGVGILARRRLPSLRPPAAGGPLQRVLGRLLGLTRQATPTTRAAAIGGVSALLPCGWLYAFVVTAGGTGRVGSALLVMSVFWVGTLPAMLTAGVAIQRLSGPLRARLPLLTATAVILMGALSIAGRLGVTVPAHPATAIEAHGHSH